MILNSSFRTIDHDIKTFPWKITVQRIAHHYIIFVTHQNRHSIFNADIITEYTSITDITAVFLSIQIHCFQSRIVVHINGKMISLGSLTSMTSVIKILHSSLFCILFSVEIQIAKGKYRIWLCSQPEIHQIKMMRRFVYQ